MPQVQQHKRKRAGSGSQSDKCCSRKKPKLDHASSTFCYPPHFFDNLSHTFLTKDALKELNQRNSPPHVQYLRPVTRAYSASTKRRLKPEIEIALVLPKPTKAHKLYAKHGGPDLQDLRGVCYGHRSLLILANIRAASSPFANY